MFVQPMPARCGLSADIHRLEKARGHQRIQDGVIAGSATLSPIQSGRNNMKVLSMKIAFDVDVIKDLGIACTHRRYHESYQALSLHC